MSDIHSIHGLSSLDVADGDAGTIWHFALGAFSVPDPVAPTGSSEIQGWANHA